MPKGERADVLGRLIFASVEEAEDAGRSLALIRPKETLFYHKRKTDKEIMDERKACMLAARQESFLGKRLAGLQPSPFQFRFKFEDGTGKHGYANGDWEAHAMFFPRK